MIYRFGRFAVQLIGEADLLPAFPTSWQASEGSVEDSPPDAVLHIHETPELCQTAMSDGWTVEDSDGEERWIYSDGRDALFAVQFGASQREVTVLASRTNPYGFRVGMQFGLMLALREKCIGLHGVTILCGDEIVILSAPSGTGKTTLAHLLETYRDALVINGDFALLSVTEEGVIFEPTPFCGSSGRCLNHRFRVDRVVFLEQSLTNVWRSLPGREAMVRFLNNVFVPSWNGDMQQLVQTNIMKAISALKVNAFSFAPEREAAEMCFRHLSPNEEDSST